MSQKLPSQQQNHTSLARIPQSTWARILLIFIAITACWQLLTGSQISIFWSTISVITVILVANTFEDLQSQITILQKQVFNLQQHNLDTMQDHHITDQKTAEQQFSHDNFNQHITHVIDLPPALEPNKNYLPSDQSIFTTPNPQNQQQTTTESIKEFKVMTSLWDAVINWFKGGNSIVRIAIVILMIGVVLLLRFASEYWSLTLSARMTGIATAGFALTALGYILRQKRFDYAISLQGAGLGIVFLVLFSSYRLDVIQSIGFSYAGLSTLLALTLFLAIRQNALFLAFIALGSGFIAPFILNTGSNDIPALMGYLFVLNFALAIIAYFKPWRILNTLALLMTFGIGGFAIWFNATPEQYFQVSCWVWAIFVLYLFISIRYSQHIAKLNTEFKDVPFVDTSLIFATPFMAFSLYAGLVNSDGYTLSIASAILAVIYVVMGYVLHRKSQQLSMLSQCFYGLGFVFTALILPFAFDAYWSSVGWAIHGMVVLYLGWRYHISNAKYFGSVLLLASGIATLFAHFANDQSVLLANSLLISTYATAAYFLKYPKQKQTINLQSHVVDQILAVLFLFLSFVIVPSVYHQLFALDATTFYGSSVAILLWWGILTALYRWKEKQFHQDWTIVTATLLTISILLIFSTQGLLDYLFDGLAMQQAAKNEALFACILWCVAFWIWLKQILKSQQLKFEHYISQGFMFFALIFLSIIGCLWINQQHHWAYMSAALPIAILGASLKQQYLSVIKPLWIGNIAIITIALLWLIQVSLTENGQGMMTYLVLFNPIDIASILVFVLIIYAIQPYLLSSKREVQMLSAGLGLFFGLFLISSILLRCLYHYAGLPYWSIQAWQNGTVQASLTILWASTALILTTLASRKAWRYIWMLGISVLAVVIAKLVFLDLSHSHTLTRIISFIGSGLIMLVIGYFSPLPPKQKIDA